MNTTLILLSVLITIMYLVLYSLDRYLKAKSQSYLSFITKHNIHVQLLYITLQTKTFNRMIYKISHISIPKKCNCIKYTYIYNMGVLFTILSIPVSLYIIGQSIYSNLEKPQSSSLYNLNENEEHYINVKPLVIGVNLPMSHLLYYIMSLLICIVIHELGHAVCAIHENIRLNHVGILIVFILPVIYVDIENINSAQTPISVLAKLRIYCAGIWHNVLLTLAMYFVLYTFPLAISPLYSVDQGVQVIHIDFDSPLRSTDGKLGLEPFDVIVKINDCPVINTVAYKQCLLQLNASRKRGFCLTGEFVRAHRETLNSQEENAECCDLNQTKHLCFAQINETETTDLNHLERFKRHVVDAQRLAHEEEKNILIEETQGDKNTVGKNEKDQSHVALSTPTPDSNKAHADSTLMAEKATPRHCMQARLVLDNSKALCDTDDQCSSSHCYSPHTTHRLIQISVRHKATYVLYLGRPVDVYNSLSVSGYVQKYTASVLMSYVPTVGYNIAVYISILSSGLALVNAVPCYYFDSHHIVSVLVTRPYFRFFIQASATVMLCVYFLLFIPSTLFSNPANR